MEQWPPRKVLMDPIWLPQTILTQTLIYYSFILLSLSLLSRLIIADMKEAYWPLLEVRPPCSALTTHCYPRCPWLAACPLKSHFNSKKETFPTTEGQTAPIEVALPACRATKSQPPDVGFDWCVAMNEQRVSRDHNIWKQGTCDFEGDV